MHAARIPRDKVEAIPDLCRDYRASVVCKDVDAGCAWSAEVQQQGANSTLFISGREDGKRNLRLWAARVGVVQWDINCCATNFRMIADDRVVLAALPFD